MLAKRNNVKGCISILYIFLSKRETTSYWETVYSKTGPANSFSGSFAQFEISWK